MALIIFWAQALWKRKTNWSTKKFPNRRLSMANWFSILTQLKQQAIGCAMADFGNRTLLKARLLPMGWKRTGLLLFHWKRSDFLSRCPLVLTFDDICNSPELEAIAPHSVVICFSSIIWWYLQQHTASKSSDNQMVSANIRMKKQNCFQTVPINPGRFFVSECCVMCFIRQRLSCCILRYFSTLRFEKLLMTQGLKILKINRRPFWVPGRNWVLALLTVPGSHHIQKTFLLLIFAASFDTPQANILQRATRAALWMTAT